MSLEDDWFETHGLQSPFKHSCGGKPERRTTALTILVLEKWPLNPDVVEGDTAPPGPDPTPPGLLQGPADVRG